MTAHGAKGLDQGGLAFLTKHREVGPLVAAPADCH